MSKKLKIEDLVRWIKEEGERTDICTFQVLGEVCDGCRCHRKPKARKAKAATTR